MDTEAAVYKRLKSKLPDVHWSRIEAWVGSGVPDVNGAYRWPLAGGFCGIEIWSELKVCRLRNFKTAGLWRPAQIAYQIRRSREICNVWNLVAHPRAEVLRIYSADKVAALAEDETGSVVPDLILGFRDPWSPFLELAASRALGTSPPGP